MKDERRYSKKPEDASIAELTTEANELIAILVASVRTIKKRKSR
jgi:hypothetical protein